MIGARSGQGKARSRNEIGAQESFEDDGCIHIFIVISLLMVSILLNCLFKFV